MGNRQTEMEATNKIQGLFLLVITFKWSWRYDTSFCTMENYAVVLVSLLVTTFQKLWTSCTSVPFPESRWLVSKLGSFCHLQWKWLRKKEKYYNNDTPQSHYSSLDTEEHIIIMEVLIPACHTMKQRYNNDQGSKLHSGK